MKLNQHPEYDKYLQDRETVLRCRQAVAAWRASGEPIPAEEYGIRWTYERALAFARSLQHMFHMYNRVLWEQFPYCQNCGGQCCVPDASHIGPFDAIAMTLLGLPMPALPDAISASARDCVYLNGCECAWPAEWRTIKCWSFYCLGGRWDPSASLGERHSDLAEALKGVLLDFLPDELRRYERVQRDPLVAYLDDPADFAEALGDALFEIFIAPFNERYPVIDEAPADDLCEHEDSRSADGEVLAFIAQATGQLAEAQAESLPPIPEGLQLSLDQLLADLESLEWIVLGHPAHRAQLLEEMYARYAHAPAPEEGEDPTIWRRMGDCIQQQLSGRPSRWPTDRCPP